MSRMSKSGGEKTTGINLFFIITGQKPRDDTPETTSVDFADPYWHRSNHW